MCWWSCYDNVLMIRALLNNVGHKVCYFWNRTLWMNVIAFVVGLLCSPCLPLQLKLVCFPCHQKKKTEHIYVLAATALEPCVTKHGMFIEKVRLSCFSWKNVIFSHYFTMKNISRPSIKIPCILRSEWKVSKLTHVIFSCACFLQKSQKVSIFDLKILNFRVCKSPFLSMLSFALPVLMC